MRSGLIERVNLPHGVYDTVPTEELLRTASRRAWPSTFSDEAIADAIARSRTRFSLLTEVRRPLWRWLWPWGRDLLSVMSQPLPGAGDSWSGYLVTIVSSSDRPGQLVANLSRALELSGADAEQLVTSMEHREREGESYHHVIACIPGSR